MAQCNDLFLEFDEEIKLKSGKKASLRTSRNTLRSKIKSHFKDELKIKAPKFWGQGSYMMNTTLKPIEGEYDIDDGVYLEHLVDEKEKDWPTPRTVHSWVQKAVEGHTDTPTKNKNTCVRVIYKNDYHVDFPIYIKASNDEYPKLAHLDKGWIYSDPKKLTNWFADHVEDKGSQLKRIVRYIKAWKDKKKSSNKFPSGMILTILAANNFVIGYEDDDDSALIATLQNIQDELNESFSVTRPVFPYEELLNDWSQASEDNFLNKLSDFVKIGQEALEVEDKEITSKKWIRVFGDRFPIYNTPEEDNESKGFVKKTSQPAILGNYGRSS